MANTSTDLMETILRECARTAPQPWYPSAYAQETGLAREELDASLDELRLGGLVRLTDWVQGHGQGYALTPEGRAVMDSPRLLERLRAGGVPPRPAFSAPTRPAHAEERPTAFDRGEEVRAALTGRATPTVTLVLLFLNLLVFAYGLVLAVRNQIPVNDFIAGSGQGVGEIAHETGALRLVDLTARHEWWRLITCCFVHFGLLHLGVNMYSLYVVGPLLERMWGRWGFLLLYLLSGLVGSCAMMVFSPPNIQGAGASGAIWGIMASMATWVFLNRHYLPRQLVSAWSRQLLIVFLLNVFISNLPGISASAHFGGGIAGLVLAVPLQYARHGPAWLRLVAILSIAAVPLAALAAVQMKIEPSREQGQEAQALISQHVPQVHKTLDAELKLYRGEQIAKLLATPLVQRRDDAEAAHVPTKVAGLLKQLKETADSLNAAGPNREPEVVDFVRTAGAYVVTAGRFYQLLEMCLDDQQLWTVNKHEPLLIELNRRLLSARSDLEKLLEHVAQ